MHEHHEPLTNDPITADEAFKQERYVRIAHFRKLLATPRLSSFMAAQEKTGSRVAGATAVQFHQWLDWASEHALKHGQMFEDDVLEGEPGEYSFQAADFFLAQVSEKLDELEDRISDLQSDAYP